MINYNYIPSDADEAFHVLTQHCSERYPDRAYEMLSKEQLIKVCKFLQEELYRAENDD